MNAEPFKDKFVAFVDVLGFKSMVADAERGVGRSFDDINEILSILENRKNKDFYASYGPQVCPSSKYIRKDLDFEITQISDCSIVSSEVSPAGAINILQHCWGSAIMLLTKGVMVRGYITRGPIFHEGIRVMGTGYHKAYESEATVSAFKQEADERGTPFIEVDPSVVNYISTDTDECVLTMFGRMVKRDGDLTALFPFQRLSHSFMIGGIGVPKFDAEKEKRNNDVVRRNLHDLKERVMKYIDPGNERALRKVRHYIAALDAQLKACDETDRVIDDLIRPVGRR